MIRFIAESICIGIIYENVKILVDVRITTILPPGGHNFGCHDRPRYNRVRVIVRRVVARADCTHVYLQESQRFLFSMCL